MALVIPGAEPPVLAAGALVWRQDGEDTKVLLVHRPRYDDWSIPKGKLDPGETLPGAAVREVGEETGYRVRLERPLPASVYLLPDGRSKIVQYWTGTIRSRIGPGPKNPREIDDLCWVTLDEAESMLTRQSDRLPVITLRNNLESETAGTRPIIIQRHAAALSRSKWRKGEKTRPLNSKGTKQSKMLDAFDPDGIVSSPWKRCRETVRPFARRAGLDVSTKDALTEADHAARPAKTAALIERVIQQARPVVLCTHRPVLPTVIDVVQRHATKDVALELPREDPYLAASEALVLHVTGDGRVVAIERHQPDVK
jgi:8-oxo-dGTP diphosphatase